MASQNKNSKQHQPQQIVVSTMIKQGFISDPLFLSPSRTLFDIISTDPPPDPKPQPEQPHHNNNKKQLQEKVSHLLHQPPFSGINNNPTADVSLTLAAKSWEGESPYRVTVDVHRKVLAARSRFFAEKLRRRGTHSVEILDCDDVAVYLEAVLLMYSGDELKRKLVGMDLSSVLPLLKICSAIMFDDAVKACLEYIDAVPWSEEEEENVVLVLNELQLDGLRTNDVLKRVTYMADVSNSCRVDDVFLKLSFSVLQAKDDKARREMKELVYRLIREDGKKCGSVQNRLDISRDTLYHLCHRCLSSLILCLSGAAGLDEGKRDRGALMGEIAREADNMQWVVDVLIDRKMGDEFVKLWADQKELAALHSKIPVMYRHEISKITAQLCVSIGKGIVLVPKDARFGLLSTWLEALYDDFPWIRRGGKAFDKKALEEGLSHMILTLPLPQQQLILMNWFDKFLNKGDDCPNIQKAFEIWWRRAFVKQYADHSKLQMTVYEL